MKNNKQKGSVVVHVALGLELHELDREVHGVRAVAGVLGVGGVLGLAPHLGERLLDSLGAQHVVLVSLEERRDVVGVALPLLQDSLSL